MHLIQISFNIRIEPTYVRCLAEVQAHKFSYWNVLIRRYRTAYQNMGLLHSILRGNRKVIQLLKQLWVWFGNIEDDHENHAKMKILIKTQAHSTAAYSYHPTIFLSKWMWRQNHKKWVEHIVIDLNCSRKSQNYPNSPHPEATERTNSRYNISAFLYWYTDKEVENLSRIVTGP